MSAIAEKPAKSRKFEDRRALLVGAAAQVINQSGVKGMTFARVAGLVGMNGNNVAYYFKRKELLAQAAFIDTLERIEARLLIAAKESNPRARVKRYLDLVFEANVRIREGAEPPMAALSDIRSLEDPYRQDLIERYQKVFREVRGLFGAPVDDMGKALATARAHVLLESVQWLAVWLRSYSTREVDRVKERLFEIFDKGIAPPNAQLTATRLEIPLVDAVRSTEVGIHAFLQAATRLINQRGYRGASVERIASELNVTKGSFYHHLEAKDDLVLECFRHSYDMVSQTIDVAHAAGGTYRDRITATITTLVDIQFSDKGPLLRTTALSALPAEHREDVLARSNRLARRLAGMLIDGISEGTIRPVDPLIASQLAMAMLNAAFELRGWAERLGTPLATEAYTTILITGLFDDPPSIARG